MQAARKAAKSKSNEVKTPEKNCVTLEIARVTRTAMVACCICPVAQLLGKLMYVAFYAVLSCRCMHTWMSARMHMIRSVDVGLKSIVPHALLRLENNCSEH